MKECLELWESFKLGNDQFKWLSQLSEILFYHLFYLGAAWIVIERTSIFLFLKQNKNIIEH